MLIINNGVPKSGSSWIQSALTRLFSIDPPSKTWLRKRWVNPSIEEAKLAQYLQSGECAGRAFLIKAHYRPHNPLRELFRKHDVRLIVSYRNIPDTIVSLYHHEHLHNNVTISLKNWLALYGDLRAREYLWFREGWSDMALMLRFEDFVRNPRPAISKIADYIDQPLHQEELTSFISGSIVKRKKAVDGAHIRTGGAGARHELPDHWLRVFTEIEAAALQGN